MAVYGGVNDPRMGDMGFQTRCKTCDCNYGGNGGNMDDCPGHFGHIELCMPVYHCGFIDEVCKILKCVCFHCYRLLIDEKNFKDRRVMTINDPETRLNAIHMCCRDKKKCMTANVSDSQGLLDAVGVGLSELTIEGEGGMNIGGEDGENGNTGEKSEIQVSGCGGLMPRFSRKGMSIEVEYPDDMDYIPGNGDKKQKLSARQAYEILRNITDEDVKKLGLDPKWARPEWLLVSVLPVPPPHVRPSVQEGDTPSEDDLTHVIINIVKANVTLENSISKGDAPHLIEEYEQYLQHKVTSFFDNERSDSPSDTQRTGRALKTLRARLRGKEGRIRGNLMGKRVDYSARTVITADPNLSIDQVGVPKSIATRLTVPVSVTPFNIHELTALVTRSIEKGPLEWPGAMYIIRADKSRVDLRYVRSSNDVALEYGWVVERHLKDDDIILFNRQPSLHKMSIMGHRAKVLDWSTFRLNLSVTTPYNADFDGDEMNLHVPQSITARADAQELMMVPRNIVTPQSNRNVMGIVQDALLGCSRITKRDVFIDKNVFMNCMMWIGNWDGVVPAPAIYKPKPLWTGKQLFSLVCPKINYRGKSKNHNSGDNVSDPFNYLDSEVLIHSGCLLQGIVDKNIVGTSGGSVVHITWLQLGWEETRAFMNEVQNVVNYWMANTSYTVSVSDTVADKKTVEGIQETLDDAKSKVLQIMSRAQQGLLEMMPGKPLMESFEMNINEVLAAARTSVGKRAQLSLKARNAIKGTVMAGSKGSENNISQIIACVGQQNVQGARIKYGFNQRTLPHFAKDDLGMESRGFVENSYLRGLSPQEFYFHAMAGREGVIDTAVKTSETGYIQRRLVKAMETVMARYDTTLRNSRGCIMQFLYGEDGLDAQRVERQYFDTYKHKLSLFKEICYLDISSESLGQLKHYNYSTGEPSYYMNRHVVDSCKNDPELRILLDEEFEQLLLDREELRIIMKSRGSGQENDESIYLPVNIDRLIWNAQRLYRINLQEPTSLHPKLVIDTIKNICRDKLLIVRGDDPLSREAQENATLLFQILLRSKLSTKRVLKEYRLNEEALAWLSGQIVSDFHAAVIHPGEMCGVLAAQSLGEPATQMTLNTFHNTGIGSKNVTLGVPRLNEILNVARNIKTPSLTINLRNPDDADEAKLLISVIEYTTLGDICLRTEIHYDPDPRTTVIEEDLEFVEQYFMVGTDEANPDDMSPWLLRIVLDPKGVNLKNLDMAAIETKITDFFGKGVHVIYTDDNSDFLVLRIRILVVDEDRQAETDDIANGSADHELLRRLQKKLLDDLHLCGVAGIKKVYISGKTGIAWSDAQGFETSKEWLLETDGTNLAEVISLPSVDHTTTVSNDIVEMWKTLGIEGARSSLFNELRNVLSFDGAYVNYRHIACLADCMTFGGYLMAVTRHGINRGESGPMLRASFEETVEIFMNAAVFSQYDILNGVTENVMLGQLGKLGTGFVDLLIDHDKLKNAIDFMGADGINEEQSDDIKYEGAMNTPGVSTTPWQSGTPGGTIYGGLNTPTTGSFTPGGHTPFPMQSPGMSSPGYSSPYQNVNSPSYNAFHSPVYKSISPSHSSAHSPVYSPSSNGYSPTSPAFSPTSPAYSPTSPAYSPTSPAYSPNNNQ
jgi:DNA-directed RNA polymerase II subunit RPB1